MLTKLILRSSSFGKIRGAQSLFSLDIGSCDALGTFFFSINLRSINILISNY